MAVGEGGDQAELLRRAVNLFTFLSRAQQMLSKPIRTVDKFENVLWFDALPDHPSVRSADRAAELEPDGDLLVVDRMPKLDPPAVPEALLPWLDGAVDDFTTPPTLREAIYRSVAAEDIAADADGDESGETRRRIEITEVPVITAAFDEWLAMWRLWAEQECRDSAVRDIYKDLFGLSLTATDHSEQFELVLGVGCLSWQPENHDRVLRHVATTPIAITLDEHSGALTIRQVPAPEAISIELDMLDPALIANPAKIEEIRQLAREFAGHPLDQPAIGDICRRLAHRLDPDAEYDEDALAAPTGSGARAAFAPAIILRRRTNRGLVQIYEEIVSQLQTAGEIPDGILPLIDPDRQPVVEHDPSPGALITLDGEDFLPLPVNERQRSIIERVDRTAQTVVQGPPGTGKTHTAAALVSHLLAQGKRVLITAHSDRALREVRDKLPREIRSLAVSVIGQSRTDMADLRTAVEQIARRADDFDPVESARSIKGRLETLDRLRRQRAEAYDRLIAVRRQEVETREHGTNSGTLAAIAYQNLQDQSRFDWIGEFGIDTDLGRAVRTDDIMRWRRILLDQDVRSHETEAGGRLPDLSVVATPQAFADLVAAEQQSRDRKDGYRSLLQHESFDFVRSLSPAVRDELRRRVAELADQAVALERRSETWLNEALHDIRSGRQQTWSARAQQIKSLDNQAEAQVRLAGLMTAVAITGGEPAAHQQIAKSLLAYLESGGKLKVQPDGTPKIGAFTAKTVKLAEPFFAQVKVNGLPATTAEQLASFIAWTEASRALEAMDQAWPQSAQIPDEDTLAEWLQWHRTEVAQLDKVLALGERLERERAWFTGNDLPVPDWNKLDDIRRYASLVEAAAAADELAAATVPLQSLQAYLGDEARWPASPTGTAALLSAVGQRDFDAYVTAYDSIRHLHEVRAVVAERDRIRAGLDGSAPRLAEAIAAAPSAPEWDDRLASYSEAVDWESTRRWVIAQDCEDANVLRTQLNEIERHIRLEVERLAAERAWGHAVAPGRLSGSARANLTQYAQLVSALGKGTGKYAAQKRVEIQEAMDRCRPSVPVWIMPIYRIAEQVRVQPNLYDVVIVDEASQAGLEASFLQYLAPKIVVIGDDKQVSPSAVGVDQQHLRDLSNQFLFDDPYKASWLDPKRSYFDEATMRFGGRITLVEHRRCVPEIIGFSNRIAYQPEGVPLIPVRQFGAERLKPIKVVHLAEGYEANNKTNPVEADRVVEQIQKCIADPHYDGLTFGVISLLGTEQAKLIERKLQDAVPLEEWSGRDLRCGDATDFQGSERNVMFLSMVKALDPAKKIPALTKSDYVQRFNVAASRAKDQMWVYHSVPLSELTNKEDMRYQLLDYCYGVAGRNHNENEGAVTTVVPEDLPVPPFDSLFEQRVFNRIIDRGYTVIPQYPALGYRIDLVIVGAKGKLAVECDGDYWHGEAQYHNDLGRQRELERCEWEFFRIRESVFYADMPGTLAKLWETLDELDIHPSDWVDANPDGAEEETAEMQSPVQLEDPVETEIQSEADEQLNGAPDPVFDGDDRLSRPVLQVVPEATADEASESGRVERPVESALSRPEADTAAVVAGLQQYPGFDEALPPIGDTAPEAMVTNIVRIVAAEGPLVGERLHQAYVRAAGGQRVGREIARVLNGAITRAERQGKIVADNPLNESGVKPKTYRLASQPRVLPRELGPRTLDLMPPAELAHHLAEVAQADGLLSDEELFRAVLDRLGLKRLTQNVKVVLERAFTLVDDEVDATG